MAGYSVVPRTIYGDLMALLLMVILQIVLYQVLYGSALYGRKGEDATGKNGYSHKVIDLGLLLKGEAAEHLVNGWLSCHEILHASRTEEQGDEIQYK